MTLSRSAQGETSEQQELPRGVAVRLAVLDAFVDTTSDAMFSIDTADRIATWNRAAERVFGYDLDEIVGSPWDVLFPHPLSAGLRVLFDAVAEGDRIDRHDTEIERRDETRVVASLSLCAVVHDGTRVGTVAIVQDIAEQRLAQAMLGEAEARLREGEALAHVGRWLWDVATGAVQWSDEFHRIHGVDPLDFDGTFEAHVGFVHPEDRERVVTALQHSVASGRAFDEEYRLVRPDGDVCRILCRAEPTIDVSGEVVGLRGFGHDLTGRSRDE